MKAIKRAELKKNAKSGCYSFKAFAKYKVVALFSSRRFRINFTPGTRESITHAHRKIFCRYNRLELDQFVCLEQVHGANIVRVGEANMGKGVRSDSDACKGTDASLTNIPNVVLAVRSADCAPLFFLDKRKKAIGMAHVGWKGASEKLPSKMIQAFRRQFLSKPEDMIIGFGPMIRPCCYEVGAEFRDVFGQYVFKRDIHYIFDLPGWITEDLKSEGIGIEQIYDSQFCTSCMNDEFPSYRKEGTKVRHMWSVLTLTY